MQRRCQWNDNRIFMMTKEMVYKYTTQIHINITTHNK
jgi:hypothetical protein